MLSASLLMIVEQVQSDSHGMEGGYVSASRSKAKANEPRDPRRGRPNRKAPS
jgi:hypothetical protein